MFLLKFCFELIHCFFEFVRPSRFCHINFLNDFIRNVCELKQNHYKIWLLTLVFDCFFIIIIGLCVAIVDNLFSLWYVWWNEAEVIHVGWVGKNIVPRSSYNSNLWIRSIFDCLDSVWISVLESEVIFHVVVHCNHLSSLVQFNDFKEIWKILINWHLFSSHTETPLRQLCLKESLHNLHKYRNHCNKHKWSSPIHFLGLNDVAR